MAHHRFFKSPCRLGALRCKACWWRSGRAAAPRVCRGAAGCESARVTVTTRLAFLAATWDVGARVGVTDQEELARNRRREDKRLPHDLLGRLKQPHLGTEGDKRWPKVTKNT